MGILEVVVLDEWNRVSVWVADEVESGLDVEGLGGGPENRGRRISFCIGTDRVTGNLHQVLALNLDHLAILEELGVVPEGYILTQTVSVETPQGQPIDLPNKTPRALHESL